MIGSPMTSRSGGADHVEGPLEPAGRREAARLLDVDEGSPPIGRIVIRPEEMSLRLGTTAICTW